LGLLVLQYGAMRNHKNEYHLCGRRPPPETFPDFSQRVFFFPRSYKGSAEAGVRAKDR
jgi:hypothetical protein